MAGFITYITIIRDRSDQDMFKEKINMILINFFFIFSLVIAFISFRLVNKEINLKDK